MTGLEWFLAVALWAVGVAGALTYLKLVEARETLAAAAQEVEAVPRMTRQESTDQLPISIALYGAWAHPGRDDAETLAAVKAAVRELHPDLASALDRCVDAYTTRANLAARRPDPETALPAPTTAAPGRFGTTPALEACNRGEHPWRTEEQLGGVQTCPTCGAMRGLV